ncbi:hypothetical protein AVEN_120954-1 [Araneus ventricosus]|uniref:Uncharacterized protein n=1 Tax=Araneus ventricosus TaxID=182803 RepID=A0A4Y2EEZ8_ARAVE|nr:hypothetical protein AVEN_120954-1 [Araneus ventricosus]
MGSIYLKNIILRKSRDWVSTEPPSIVIFDGYPEETTAKNKEQNRRASRHSSCDIAFEENTVCITAREEFLGNKTNKEIDTGAGIGTSKSWTECYNSGTRCRCRYGNDSHKQNYY